MEKATEQEEKAAAAATTTKSGNLACCSRKSSSGSETTKEQQQFVSSNNNRFHLSQHQLGELVLPKRPPLDVEFKDVTYTVAEYSVAKFTRTKKEILHGVEGCFRSGELTAIMGPSGAGKSSLLNILAGLTSTGMKGDIFVNGRDRRASNEARKFQSLSRYIQQDDSLRPYLTAGEAMTIASHLKLGYSVDDRRKRKQVNDILSTLGLERCYKVLTGNMSGGQRKRLAIALELLSNPSILFLDEPTTGLDSASCSQCISLLKRLSQEGRTVICTVHQPSALIFEMFDKLYALADGFCIYRGPVKQLVPFLGSQGLVCPPFHNPADFLIEIAIDEQNTCLEKLADAASLLAERNKTTLSNHLLHNDKNGNGIIMHENISFKVDTASLSNCSANSDIIVKSPTRANQFRQTWLLFKRNILIARRNYSLLLSRFVAHILIGLLFGYLYHNVGNSAQTVLANYIYLYGTLLLVVYTGKMSVTLSFPLEMEILKREHFNKWYNLGPYFISTIALEIPFQIICCTSYVSISYVMTGNLIDSARIFYFFIISIATSLCAQSWGYFIGATTPVKIAVFIAPVLAVLFSVFGFCITLMNTPMFFRWLFHASYFRAGFHSLVYSVYGLSRGKLACEGDGVYYCHYHRPEMFLKEMDIIDIDIWTNIGFLIGLGVFMHLATAGALWCRLNRR